MLLFISTAPTAPPQVVQARSENSTTLVLSWQPPPLDNQNGIIANYTVNITETETGTIFSVVAATTTVNLSSLHPFYSYSCVVAAVTVDLGPFSAPVVLEMPEDGRYTHELTYHLAVVFNIYYALYIQQQHPPVLQ